MRAGHGPKNRNEDNQDGPGWNRIAKERDRLISAGQSLGHDPGAHDRGDEDAGSEGFGKQASVQRGNKLLHSAAVPDLS